MGDRELFLDIRRSMGLWSKRKLHDFTGRVSDGYSPRKNKVMWTPWLKKWRTND
jgi:hypothetical protein